MKKKLITVSLIILVVVVCIYAWFIGYYNRKSQDNLPSLENAAQMDEAELNELLVGYYNYQLTYVWEEPDKKSDNTWFWKINEYTQLQVSSNNKGKIVSCGLDSIFQAEILEIFEDYYLVEPLDGSPELESADKIEISVEHLNASQELEVGDIVEIIHGGEILETYPARLQSVHSIEIVRKIEKWDLIPMVMVNGELYLDTGHESTVDARCGVMDGEITSQVDGNEKPTVNNQSNFGSGFGYQYGAQEGTIEIYMNDEWRVFATEKATDVPIK